jgi:hypothetical protein
MWVWGGHETNENNKGCTVRYGCRLAVSGRMRQDTFGREEHIHDMIYEPRTLDSAGTTGQQAVNRKGTSCTRRALLPKALGGRIGGPRYAFIQASRRKSVQGGATALAAVTAHILLQAVATTKTAHLCQKTKRERLKGYRKERRYRTSIVVANAGGDNMRSRVEPSRDAGARVPCTGGRMNSHICELPPDRARSSLAAGGHGHNAHMTCSQGGISSSHPSPSYPPRPARERHTRWWSSAQPSSP